MTSLAKGLKILDLLLEVEADVVRRRRGLSIQQIANELGIHKSTASRLMGTLVACSYAVPRDDGARGYRLGPALQTHQGLSIEQRRLQELAHPYLVDLVALTHECAHAAVASGSSALVIDDVETAQALRVVAGKGRRVPLHCTSAGKCLLAWEMALVPPQLPARTARTITHPDILRLHLEEVRLRGWALDDEENDVGVRCISAPVFGAGGEPVGCIGIDGPSIRLTQERVSAAAAAVTATAARLSAAVAERDSGDGEQVAG